MRAARASTLYAVLLLLPLLLSGCSRNEAVYRTQGIWLIQFGALARLCAAVGPATAREALLMGAALAWTLAFSLYVAVYGRYLWQARIDGKEG